MELAPLRNSSDQVASAQTTSLRLSPNCLKETLHKHMDDILENLVRQPTKRIITNTLRKMKRIYPILFSKSGNNAKSLIMDSRWATRCT